MRKILKKLFINKFKNIFYMLQNSNSKYFEFNKVVLKIKRDSAFGKKNAFITSRIDQLITPNILKSGKWDYFIIEFINKYCLKKRSKFNFVDVGANIGLISLQLINTNRYIKNYFCVEPDIQNYNILKENLSVNKTNNINTYNYALIDGKNKKKQKIFIDKSNFGNYSLIKKNNYQIDYVKSYNAKKFLNRIINKYGSYKFIYKSDTQGYDEIILLSLGSNIIKRFKILILEISNFDFLARNIDKFIEILDQFDEKVDEKGRNLNNKNILEKISSRKEFNLLLSKT
tara:strand:+ start:1115 stop:1972 length:858 start_codon:yes stop_codon:yes gene_type:complete